MKKTVSIMLTIIIVCLSTILPAAANEKNQNIASCPGDPQPLGNDTVKYDTEIILCDEKNSIFFFTAGTLYELKLDTGRTEKVEEFNNVNERNLKKCSANNKLYYVNDHTDNSIHVFNLLTLQYERDIPIGNLFPNAIGVDESGRIFVADNRINDYSINLINRNGKKLSRVDVKNKVLAFDLFDAATGSFYVSCQRELPYDNSGTTAPYTVICKGQIVNNKISYNEENYSEINCEWTSTGYNKPVGIIGGKYLAVAQMKKGVINLYKPGSDDFEHPIYSISTDRAVSMCKFGPACLYRESTGTLIAPSGDNNLSEYDLKTGKILRSVEFVDSIRCIADYGGKLFILCGGKELYYYLVDWKEPTRLTLNQTSVVVDTNTALRLSAKADTIFAQSYRWTSSNPLVAGVTSEGRVFGWKNGEAVITCDNGEGLTAKCKVKVTGAARTDGAMLTLSSVENTLPGNQDANNYSVYSRVVNSYMTELKDGTFETVHGGKAVTVTRYNAKLNRILGSKSIPVELDYFGGFYSGENYNYLVFGQDNPDESNDVEVIRVVKYSKSWQRLGDTRISACNTASPFHAGSLRMTECAGKLYVYTCHLMYKSNEGRNHQANLTFVIEEETGKILQQYYGIWTLSLGYVSHSFNQFIANDGEYVYRVDHGDAYPRGIALTKCAVNGSILDNETAEPLHFSGFIGANKTGASVGGMAVTPSQIVIAANCNELLDDWRNIVIISVDKKDLKNKQLHWLTNYTETDRVDVYTPQLVQLTADKLLVMWRERNKDTKRFVTKAATLDHLGNLTSEIAEFDAALSDCQPVVCADHLVRWYVSDGTKTTFYTLNSQSVVEYHSVCIGDLNGNGRIDISDVTKLQRCLAEFEKLSPERLPLADADHNGIININDATFLQRHLADLNHT